MILDRMKKVVHDESMKILSDKDVLKAMEVTVRLAEELGFPPKVQLHLRLVTEEAIVNALEYGITKEQKWIEVCWYVTSYALVMAVKQKGKSFNLKKDDAIKYGQRGRGLQLIQNIMDKVCVKEEGQVISLYMQKNISG